MCRKHPASFAAHRSWSIAALLLMISASTFPCRSSAEGPTTPKMLGGRETLTAGEAYCIPVTVHPNRAVNLGAGQLTVTLSSESKGNEDVVLVASITQPQITLLKGSSRLNLCGVVPQLAEKQEGPYFASDFAIHFGSGNVTNIGTPDNSLVDTAGLAKQLQALHPTFKQ